MTKWRSADYVIASTDPPRCSELTLNIIFALYDAATEARLAVIAESARRVRRRRTQRHQSMAR